MSGPGGPRPPRAVPWLVAVAVVAVVAALVVSPAAGSGFAVEISPGLDPANPLELPFSRFWSRQWVRSRPPGGEPATMVVRGPRRWLEEPGQALDPVSLADADAAGRAELLAALEGAGWLDDPEPALRVARILAALRPVAVDGAAPPGRHGRVWRLWEVLADPSQVDARSVAVAALLTAADAGVEARLALFEPAPGAPLAWGLWLDGASLPEALEPVLGDGAGVLAGRVDGGVLLLVVPLAVGEIPDELAASWSWRRLVEAGWDGVAPEAAREPTAAPEASTASGVPEAGSAGSRPSLCEQARALGFDCVVRQGLEPWQLNLLSGLLAALLVAVGLYAWRQRRRFRERVARQRRWRAGGPG